MKNGLGNKQVMARNIQRLMEQNGKTRMDLCNDLGLKYTTVTDWLKGNTHPRIDAIEKMARYFGVNKVDLVEEPAVSTVITLMPRRANWLSFFGKTQIIKSFSTLRDQ